MKEGSFQYMTSCHCNLGLLIRNRWVTWSGSLRKGHVPFKFRILKTGKATRKLNNKGRLQIHKRYREFVLESKHWQRSGDKEEIAWSLSHVRSHSMFPDQQTQPSKNPTNNRRVGWGPFLKFLFNLPHPYHFKTQLY